MKKLINLTPHKVSVYDKEGKLIEVFQSEGNARVSETVVEVESKANGVPCFQRKLGTVEGLPVESDDTMYIVSFMIKLACPGRHDLLVPGELVRNENGNILGCRGFYV